MREPRSEFVRSVIANLPFTKPNRRYVRDLIIIETLAVRRPSTWGGGMLDEHLRATYADAYDAIVRELNPQAHAHDLASVLLSNVRSPRQSAVTRSDDGASTRTTSESGNDTAVVAEV